VTDDWTQDADPDVETEHYGARPVRDVERELRLRPEPQRVTRLSRKVLIGVGGLGAIGLGGALILALETKDAKPPEQELYTTGHKSAADGLAALPSNYAAIPKLGPPLPGDFGRAMLDQTARGTPQAEGGKLSGAAAGTPPNPVAQRRSQEDDAAKHGSVFASRASSETEPSTVRDAEPKAQEMDRSASAGGSETASAPSAAERKAAFLTAPSDRKTINSSTLESPTSPYVVQAGSIIPAALVSGVRSDLPGQVIAQVRETVYDSPTGRTPLIPQGARLIGTYDNDIAAGQSRVLIAWTRLILPDGRSLTLDRMPAADAAGQSGLADRTDYHWGGLFRAALVSTLLGIGAQSGTSNSTGDLTHAIQQGASDSISRSGRQVVDREVGRPPTITIRPGMPVNVMVTRDLILAPAGVVK
jgi:type IV secretory pathway VirB10-like protein